MKASPFGRSLRGVAIVGVLTLLAGCIVYPQHSRHRFHQRPPAVSGSVALTLEERQVIRTYVLAHDDSGDPDQTVPRGTPLPAGLVRKVALDEALPAGWESKVVKGCVLPLDVFNQCCTLPDELVMHLPAPPSGTVTIAVDGKVLRLARATREILDVFEVIGSPVNTSVAVDLGGER
jgi:hypothetical protein